MSKCCTPCKFYNEFCLSVYVLTFPLASWNFGSVVGHAVIPFLNMNVLYSCMSVGWGKVANVQLMFVKGYL